MDHSSNQWSYFNKLYPNFHDKTCERIFKRKISLLPSTSVPCSCPYYRPRDNKQRRNYYSYFNDVYDSKVSSKGTGSHVKTERATCENLSSRKRRSYHDKRLHNERDARFVKATTARLIKRLNDPQLITIPENELLMKKRILEKTKELLQLIEFRQSYHKHLVEFKRLVSKLSKWITLIMKYTEDDYSELSKLDSNEARSRSIQENIFEDESDSDNSESTTRIKSFKYWFEKTHRSKKRNKMKKNVLTKAMEVQCTSMFSMKEKWPSYRRRSIHKETKSIQWLGMSDKSTQLYSKRKSSRKKYHQKMNVQLQTTKGNFLDNECCSDLMNQTTGIVSVANCIPLLYKTPKDPFVFSSAMTNSPKVQNTEPYPSESEREWTSQEDEVFKEPKVTINLRTKSPSLIVEYPQDEFCNDNKKEENEILSAENKVMEIEIPNTLSSCTSCQSTGNRERRKQIQDSLAIKNIFTTDFFDGNSTDNETIYCGFEIEELSKKRSCSLTNTTSENDSIIHSKKVTKVSRLTKPQTSNEACEVKFKCNRNICTFSVNYNPSKVLSALECTSDQSQLNNEELEITKTEKITTTKQNTLPKEFGEITSNQILQSDSLIDTSLLNTITQKCDDANNLSIIRSGSLSENDVVKNPKNDGEATSKNNLLSKSEATNKIKSKRKWKCNVISDAIKRKNKYVKIKKRRSSFSKQKKSQLENKSRNVNKDSVSATLDVPRTEIDHNVDANIVDTKSEVGDAQCLEQGMKQDDNVYVPQTKTSETTVQRDIIETSKTIEEILNAIVSSVVDLNPNNDNLEQQNKDFGGTNFSNNSASTRAVAVDVGISKNSSFNDIKKSEMTENDIDECRELNSFNKSTSISNATITKTSSPNDKKVVENKTVLQESLETKTHEPPTENRQGAMEKCSLNTKGINVSEMTENDIDDCKELNSFNKSTSISKSTITKTSSPNDKKVIENKTSFQKPTENLESKTHETLPKNHKSAKGLCSSNVKGIYVTKKLPLTCSNSEKSRIPKWRSMTVPPSSKKLTETVNKNEPEKTRPKTEPSDPISSNIIDQPAEKNSVEKVETTEIKGVFEDPNTTNKAPSVELKREIKTKNMKRNKVVKVSRINAQKRPGVSEEDITAKRRRTSSEERKFPSSTLTRPTISSINKQNKEMRKFNISKFHINCLRNKGKGPVKILTFSRKTLTPNKHFFDIGKSNDTSPLIHGQCKFRAEPYKINCREKKIKFQSEDVFQQFRNVLCARRSRKQDVPQKQVAQKSRNTSRGASPTGTNKKQTKELTVEKPDPKPNDANVLNTSQNDPPKTNLDNSKCFCDTATQSIDPIKRKAKKRLGQSVSKYHLSRYPLWYTLKRRWNKEKKRKTKNNTTLNSKCSSPSDGQENSLPLTNCQRKIVSITKSRLQLQTHLSNDNLNSGLNESHCIKMDKLVGIEIHEKEDTENVGFEKLDQSLQTDNKRSSDATHETENGRKLKQDDISSESGQLAKALEELKRYIESAITKGIDEKQRKNIISLSEDKHKSREDVLKHNSEEMFKNALKTLHSSENKYFKMHPDERSSIIDGNTTSFSSFTKTQSLATLSTSESVNNIGNDNEFKLSFSSVKVREFIKKSCRTVSRIPVPLNIRRSSSEQKLHVICPKKCSKLSSSSTHSISSGCARHHPSMMCCNQLDTCSIFLFEVARHSREWSKWVRQIFSGFNKFTSFIRDIKDDDVKLEEFYLKEWREFTAMVDKMLASWRQYSKEVKKVTEHAIRKFKTIDDRCCPKCIEDGIISDRTMMREVAQKLIDAITTAELWRTWLDDIMKQASLLVDLPPNDKHQKNVVDYSKHTYDDMVQTFSQIAFCIGEASKVIQKIDISELNK